MRENNDRHTMANSFYPLSYPADHPNRCIYMKRNSYPYVLLTKYLQYPFPNSIFQPDFVRQRANMKFFAILSTMVFAALVVAGPLQDNSDKEGQIEKRQVSV